VHYLTASHLDLHSPHTLPSGWPSALIVYTMPAIDLVARAKFVVVNHYQITFLVVPTIFFAVATVAVGLRWRVRRMKKTSFTVDDYLCAFTLVSFYGNSILTMC
jgi:hypothetical protein